MQKSNEGKQGVKVHRQVQASTTLNRKYVKRPVTNSTKKPTIRKSPMVSRFAPQHINKVVRPAQPKQQSVMPIQKHPMQEKVNARMKRRAESSSAKMANKMSAQQIKEQAIQKALAAASAQKSMGGDNKNDNGLSDSGKHRFGLGRVVLALSCAAAAVFAIVYFVNLNMPDISLKVAAIQTGIDASYPSYVPRDFNLSGIVSENGKITLNFTNGSSSDAFSLTEENSSWDSNALLNNFVKTKYGENYTVVREQGLTIYISGGNAAWTNGGVVYKLESTSGTLTKKQIGSIATSL